MEDHVSYTLIKGFAYATKGDTRTAEFIELNEPTGKNVFEVGKIRQGLVRAIREQQAEAPQPTGAVEPAETDADDSGPEPMDVLSVLASSQNDLSDLYANAKILLLSKGICKVDGEERLTTSLWDLMSARDSELLIATLIASFIMAS